MEDMDRYNEMTNQIAGVETFFDVFHIIAKHSLLGEVKNTSMSYLLSEAEDRLETIKKLNKESHGRLQELKKLTGVTN
jgi:hypothetical protein